MMTLLMWKAWYEKKNGGKNGMRNMRNMLSLVGNFLTYRHKIAIIYRICPKIFRKMGF